jgi:broad specificity phosphatase PhoE
MTSPVQKQNFYLIRHGQTVANAAQWRSGSIDTELTEKGRAQAREIAARLAESGIPFTSIVSSHLSRARETADIVNARLRLPRHILPELAEQDYGDWAGRTYGETPDHHLHDPPNGESREIFRRRVLAGIAQACALDPGTPLIVCHGGVMRHFSLHHGHSFPRVENCGCYRVERESETARIACLDFA